MGDCLRAAKLFHYTVIQENTAFHHSGVGNNEYQLQPGRQMQVWLIPIADECVGVQGKL